MAKMVVTGDRPTLAEWALAARENPHLADVKEHHVVAACHRRNVPLREGRIERRYAGDLYFGLMDVFGLSTAVPK
jgi:hypothetical protein